MSGLLHRLIVRWLNGFNSSAVSRFNAAAIVLCATVFFTNASAQFFAPEQNVRSLSGQFIITGSSENSPFANSPVVATNADYIRLEPALLAVSVERLKKSLWEQFAINPSMPWRGQIFLALHPARALDEDVVIISKPSAGGWDYLVRLPDVLTRTRYVRALTSVLLLEFANRQAGARPAEIPDWLTDGLAQQLLAADSSEIILSSPAKTVNGLPMGRLDLTERGLDPLADARRVLKIFPALTFERLSWPTGAQLSGADGGVYRASAQVFVARLLALKNGPAKLRALLQTLPRYYNWQTAFQIAFQEKFSRALDVEKWWALQVVDFVSRDHGPRWTLAASREKLDQILSVPVEMRLSSNALPVHAEISLQTVIRNFDSDRQAAILQTKLRDLELAGFQMASPLAVLTDAYRRALEKYLGENQNTTRTYVVNKHPQPNLAQINTRDTIKKLNQLDARRRTLEATVKPDKSAQPSLTPIKF